MTRQPDPPDPRRVAELSQIVRSPRSALDRLLRRPDPRLPAVDELARLRGVEAIFSLMPLWREKDEAGDRARRAIATVLGRVTPDELARVDEALRSWKYGGYFGGTISTAEVARIEPALLGMFASHPNGHVREAAVRGLGALRDGRELRFLALRANDWVDPIAALARSLLLERIVPANRAAVCRELPFFVGLAGRGRRNHGALFDALGETLRSDGGADFARACETLDRATRRRGYAWLLAGALPPDAPAFTAALADPDAIVQMYGVRALARVPASELVTRGIAAAARSRSPLVRAEALQLRAREADGAARLTEALYDKSALVRRRSRGLARDLGLVLDPRAHLRESLASGDSRRITGAVELVGAAGSADDAAMIAPLASHSAAQVRAAVLPALTRLAPAQGLGQAITTLTDPVRDVRRVAVAILRAHRRDLDHEAVAAAGLAAPNPAVRIDSLALLSRVSRWQALEYLLRALGDRDEAVSGRARSLLERWRQLHARSFAQPTESQRESIARALAQAASRLPPGFEDLLRSALRSS